MRYRPMRCVSLHRSGSTMCSDTFSITTTNKKTEGNRHTYGIANRIPGPSHGAARLQALPHSDIIRCDEQ
jgi:hypothetical protein